MTPDDANTAFYVSVAGRAYGPYGAAELAGFIAVGRVTGSSLIGATPHGPWTPARDIPSLAAELYPAAPEAAASIEDGAANMLIYAELSTSRRLIESLSGLGIYTEITPALSLLRTRFSVSKVRTALAQAAGAYDRVLIVDASRNRAAWHNLGPETEASFRAIWNAPLPADPEAQSDPRGAETRLGERSRA